MMRWVERLGLERQKKHSEGPGGARWRFERCEECGWWLLLVEYRKDEAWSGSGRFLMILVSGDGVLPEGGEAGVGALGSNEKAYSPFALDAEVSDATLMKRVMGFTSGFSSVGRW